MYKLGIDVGGTNTDGAILDENLNVLSSFKSPTTDDIETGINNVIQKLLEDTTLDKNNIKHAMLGTTQCTNAIVTRNGLDKVATIRIGLPAGAAIEPLYDVPDDLKEKLSNHVYQVAGGHEFNGELISGLDVEKLEEIATQIKNKVDSISITSIFSPVNNVHEIKAAKILRDLLGDDIPISLSSEIGSLGLLERENATVLNSAIQTVAERTITGFENALRKHGIPATPYFCQNDGTLMSKEYTLKYPILTVACGPTNSLRGASYLSEFDDAIIVDIGGTTTDIGVLQKGFPRESSISVELSGVQTNFRMPDIYSIALGGGTIITGNVNSFTVGPESVGYQLPEKALVFGGDTLTTTDIAVAKGFLNLGDKEKLSHLDSEFVDAVYQEMLKMIEVAVEKMKTSRDNVPVVLVGGGSALIQGDSKIEGASVVANPESGSVANAIGSAISDVSGEVEKVVNISPDTRDSIIDELKRLAIEDAVEAGAVREKTEVITFDEIPLAYLPGGATHVKVKSAGPLK